MIVINNTLLNSVATKAKASPRKRMNHNFHLQLNDSIQRMLNCLEPGTYVQPHKHENPDKREAFIVLRGRVLVVEYDMDGNIVTHVVLVPGSDNYGVEIAPGVFHSIIALEEGSTVYEVKDGPYSVIDDKNFASWAPKEGDKEAEMYLKEIMRRCDCLNI